jgi:hypothetical protein
MPLATVSSKVTRTPSPRNGRAKILTRSISFTSGQENSTSGSARLAHNRGHGTISEILYAKRRPQVGAREVAPNLSLSPDERANRLRFSAASTDLVQELPRPGLPLATDAGVGLDRLPGGLPGTTGPLTAPSSAGGDQRLAQEADPFLDLVSAERRVAQHEPARPRRR